MELKKVIQGAVDVAVEEISRSRNRLKQRNPSRRSRLYPRQIRRSGDLIAEAMEKSRQDGVITVEESKSLGTTLEVVERYAVRQRIFIRLHGFRHRKRWKL